MRKKSRTKSAPKLTRVDHFPVIAHEDEKRGCWVECPALEGCYSQGDTIDEALRNIREAIELCLEDSTSRVKAHRASHSVSLHFVRL